MIFTINGQDLAKGLNIISSSLSTRVNLAILSNILIEASINLIKITATDLETATIFQIPAKIEKDGVATVPARSFIDFFNALSGEVKVSALDNKVLVEGENNSASFNSQPSSDFRLFQVSKMILIPFLSLKNFLKKLVMLFFRALWMSLGQY